MSKKNKTLLEQFIAEELKSNKIPIRSLIDAILSSNHKNDELTPFYFLYSRRYFSDAYNKIYDYLEKEKMNSELKFKPNDIIDCQIKRIEVLKKFKSEIIFYAMADSIGFYYEGGDGDEGGELGYGGCVEHLDQIIASWACYNVLVRYVTNDPAWDDDILPPLPPSIIYEIHKFL